MVLSIRVTSIIGLGSVLVISLVICRFPTSYLRLIKDQQELELKVPITTEDEVSLSSKMKYLYAANNLLWHRLII